MQTDNGYFARDPANRCLATFLNHGFALTWTINSKNHPWEAIYRSEGKVFTEPFPRFDEVVREFEAHECKRVLDLGCGNGRHVVEFAKLGFRTVGLDISSTGLRLTREWLYEEGLDADTVTADVRRSLPFRSGSFDSLLSTQVIHQARICEVRRAIAEIWRVLAEGKVAFVTVAGRRHEGEAYEETSGYYQARCRGLEPVARNEP